MDRTYHCQFCKEIFESYKALKGHLIESHLTLKVYKCVQSSCSMMFPELEDFLEHTRSHKRSEYRCHVCCEVFNTLSDLGLHQYTHSFEKQKTSEKWVSIDEQERRFHLRWEKHSFLKKKGFFIVYWILVHNFVLLYPLLFTINPDRRKICINFCK